MTKTYRLICIADSFDNGEKTLSDLDASPNYLHIHILESDRFGSQTIDEFSKKLNDKSENETLFQWGIPLEKDAKTRSETVSAQEVKKYGHIGLGSAARGKFEKKYKTKLKDDKNLIKEDGNFVGGGEAFLFDEENFRITRGDGVFEAKDDQKYWTFQAADFNGAKKIGDLNGKKIEGRKELMELLKSKSKGKPFVAVFDAEFEGAFFARSNGIFPEDEAEVAKAANPKQTLFETDIKGGHLVGGAENQGDIDSLKQKFSEEEAKQKNFKLTIKSDVILKPISKLEIVKLDGTFRAPRTEVRVREAATTLQSIVRIHKAIEDSNTKKGGRST